MPRDGTGTFVRTNGTFSGVDTWDQQATSADPTINSQRHDTHDQDIADAMTGSLPRNGEAGMAANLSMGSNRITGLADGVNDTDAVTLQQLLQQLGGIGAGDVLYTPPGVGTADRAVSTIHDETVRLSDWASADPTGNNDASTELQAAIDQASTAGVPFQVTSGIFRFDSRLVLPESLQMRGLGKLGPATLKAGAAAAELFLEGKFILIRDLYLDCDYLADYGIRTNPATDEQRGNHLLQNVRVAFPKKTGYVINTSSDGTQLVNCESALAGERDANGKPTGIGHGCEWYTEGETVGCYFSGSTGWNMIVHQRRLAMTAGRLNSGRMGNLLVLDETTNGGNRVTAVSVRNTFIENPGVSFDSATDETSACAAIRADGNVKVTLSGLEKLQIRRARNAVQAVNGARIDLLGSMAIFGTPVAVGGNSGSYIASNDGVYEADETAQISLSTPTTVTLSHVGNWRNNDFIILPGAVSGGDDLKTRVTAGEGTTTLRIADAATAAIIGVEPFHTRREEYTVDETGTMDSGQPDLVLNQEGDWGRGDDIIVEGADTGSTDLVTSIKTISSDLLTLTLNDDAVLAVGPGAAIRKPGVGLGQVGVSGLEESIRLQVDAQKKSPEFTGLIKSQPRQNAPGVYFRDAQPLARVLDGSTLNANWTTGGLTNINVTSAPDTTAGNFVTGTDSLKVQGDAATVSTNVLRFVVHPPEGLLLDNTILYAAAYIKREQVGATMEAFTALRFRTTTGDFLFRDNAVCQSEIETLGAGQQGAFKWYQVAAYMDDMSAGDITIDVVLDTSGSRSSNDIMYIDHVDLFAVGPNMGALWFGPQ